MYREILQEKSLNAKQDNAEKSLSVDLSAKSRLIPYSTAAGMLGLYDLYTEERDACENYRMIFTVNPVCSNILYNAVTEPVYKEGSYSAICLVEMSASSIDTEIFPEGVINQSARTIDQKYAVRDTEFSHERIGDFKYHCGYDFFNNHLMRTSEFEHVKLADEIRKGKRVNEVEFNTIFDYAIDYSGKTVQRVINESEGPLSRGIIREDIRMYQLDNIRSINTAFYDDLRTVDGWYGFYNTGYINIPNGILGDKEISLNRILNNEVPCGFVDLYPDRSLYSFIPKVNRFKKRLERNWDCTIVYPYESDYDTFAIVNENEANAIKVINARVVYDNVGNELVQMHSLLRHSLQPGDEIRIFYKPADGGNITRYSVPVRVIGIGDVSGNEENRYFTVKLYEISTFCGVIENEDGSKELGYKNSVGEVAGPIQFFYRKIEGGCDDKYYFRKFKEILNYEYVQVTRDRVGQARFNQVMSNAVTVIKEPAVINGNSPKYIKLGNDYFECVSRPLTYTQNKIAFGVNIYGDRVAQVIFNDDICISGLKDNLGRPLSTVYFTAVKTNRGHKEWYEEGNLSADTVEFSHCFGEVTSGLDLPVDSASTEYNVRKLYNVFKDYVDYDESYSTGLSIILSAAPIGNYSGTPTPLESGITLEDYDIFFGDIVEFSKVNFKETVLEKVYHRFNTAQRECLENEKYFNINYDELVGDLYDVDQVDE